MTPVQRESSDSLSLRGRRVASDANSTENKELYWKNLEQSACYGIISPITRVWWFSSKFWRERWNRCDARDVESAARARRDPETMKDLAVSGGDEQLDSL